MTLNMKGIGALTERRGRLRCAGDVIHHKKHHDEKSELQGALNAILLPSQGRTPGCLTPTRGYQTTLCSILRHMMGTGGSWHKIPAPAMNTAWHPKCLSMHTDRLQIRMTFGTSWRRHGLIADLVNAGADVNQIDDRGYTALHSAAK